MSFFAVLFFSSSILISIYFHIHAAVFDIQNNCPYTVWAAAVPGGGRELRQGQSWVFNTDPNFVRAGRIWGRTNCNFDENGIGKCESGDCNGALLCVSYGNTPSTIVEYKFESSGSDFFDISLINGFNVPMEFLSTSSECNKSIKCAADINSVCPTELRDPGGCNNPCTVFNNDQFCCFGTATNCGPTAYSKFFKDLCPSVYTYPFDDATSTFICPNGTAYKVVFCP